MNVREVAEYLRLNKKTYRYATEGIIPPGFKVGGAWRFRRDEVEL